MTNPTVTGSGMVYPNQAPVFQNGMWVYPQGTVMQSGYSQPMTYYPQAQTYYQPGTLMQSGYSTPGLTYGSPTVSGVTYGNSYPATGYTTYGSNYQTYSSYPASGYSTYGNGYAYPSFSNGYVNSGMWNNGWSYPTTTTTSRRLFRR